MSTSARLHEEWHDDVPVARLEGEIDASNAEEIGNRLRTLLTNRSVALVVDLSETTYIDSAGINLLFALGAEMDGRQQRLGLVLSARSPIERIVSITGLDRVVAVEPALAEAIDRLRDDSRTAGAAPGRVAAAD
jgi:anti-sigma B factor antagonist